MASFLCIGLAVVVSVSAVKASDDSSCMAPDTVNGPSLMQKHHTRIPSRQPDMLVEATRSLSVGASGFPELASRAGTAFCKGHPCSLLSTSRTLRGVGKTASLNEVGYKKVATLKDDKEMKDFIVRVIHKYDCKVEDEGGLEGVVPWFSGTTSTQSFEKLEEVLFFALLAAGDPWMSYKNTAGVTGDTAVLDLDGYVEVASIRSDEDMKKFARRLCSQMGVKVIDEGGFEGMIKFYSGSKTFQSFERLQSEIKSAAAAPHSWASAGAGVSLLESTQKSLKDEPRHMPIFGLVQGGFSPVASRLTFTGFCKSHPCSLVSTSTSFSGLGKQASLDEAGYKKVAALKNDKEMKDFILRVIAHYDCKVDDDGGLDGVVPWFSGTTAVQSFEMLGNVLLFAVLADGTPWISFLNSNGVSGDNAALDLEGYIEVACIRNDDGMKKFARRLCKKMDVEVVDENGFDGMIKFYSGSKTFQSFERLQSEIQSAAAAPHSWARKGAGSFLIQSPTSGPDVSVEQTRSLSSSAFAARLATTALCRGHPCSLLSTNDRLRGLGKTASLNEVGYKKVAALQDDDEMKDFITRVIHLYDCKVEDEGGLEGLVPWFSGTTTEQSFQKLEEVLLFAILADGTPWISYKNTPGVTGDTAALDLEGYVQVACIKNDEGMKKFARRLCTEMGVKVVDEDGFDGMIKFYSGSKTFQSFERLQSEIKSAAAAPHSWAKTQIDSSLTQNVNKIPIAQTRTSSTGHSSFFPIASRLGNAGFCKSHPCSLMSKSVAVDHVDGFGKQAGLDEAGYQRVAALKSDKEMKDFIVRVIHLYDCKVEDEGGLEGVVPWFSGTTGVQSFQTLGNVLLFAILADGTPWISYKNTVGVSGDTASLDLEGYVQVACIRNDEGMKKFARRLCTDMGVKVVDEDGFDGMIKFYSGSKTFQSFERLQSEIMSAAAAPHSWAKK